MRVLRELPKRRADRLRNFVSLAVRTVWVFLFVTTGGDLEGSGGWVISDES